MAQKKQVARVSPRAVKLRKSKRYSAHPGRYSQYNYPSGRIKVHPGEPDPTKQGGVYIVRNALGMVKVGATMSHRVGDRLQSIQVSVPHVWRPVKMVRALITEKHLAFRIEKACQARLRHCQIPSGTDGYCVAQGEWFYTSPQAASRILNQISRTWLFDNWNTGPKLARKS